MFGRTMNEFWGKIHFLFTFVFLNATFLPMHLLGALGVPRRYADVNEFASFHHVEGLNIFITWAAVGMSIAQIPFAINFLYSLFFGPVAGRNPWHANGLEWTTPSPPGHGNFDFQPVVYRGPYEYNSPEVDADFYPQTQAPPAERPGHPAPQHPVAD
jgi:cytochrome c oxidase subunit 1